MKLAGAGVLALAALCAGCAGERHGWRDWTHQDFLELHEAREHREYYLTASDSPYWRPAAHYEAEPRRKHRPRTRTAYASDAAPAHSAPARTEAPDSYPVDRALQADPTLTAMREQPPAAAGNGTASPHLECLPDDTACAERLAQLMSDTARVWMLTPARPADYISGVRLYALHQLRDTLTCTEMKFGLQETAATLDHLAVASNSRIISQSSKARLRLVEAAARQVQSDLTVVHVRKCPPALEP